MTVLTVWKSDAGEIRLHQLTDAHDKIVEYVTVTSDVNTGTAEEPVFATKQAPIMGPIPYADQIAHLATLSFLEGFTCVSEDYTGSAPETDASLWRWNGTEITAIMPVPEIISPVQMRLALDVYGLLDAVESQINQSGGTVKIWWDHSTGIERRHPILLQMATLMNLSEAQVDEMFIFAGTL